MNVHKYFFIFTLLLQFFTPSPLKIWTQQNLHSIVAASPVYLKKLFFQSQAALDAYLLHEADFI